jgi:hypothetical protein
MYNTSHIGMQKCVNVLLFGKLITKFGEWTSGFRGLPYVYLLEKGSRQPKQTDVFDPKQVPLRVTLRVLTHQKLC